VEGALATVADTQPWTANADPKQQTEAEKQLKLQFITMLRNDLEKVRMLAEQVRKREKKKLAQAQVVKDVVDAFLFKGEGRLRLTLERISA
jgi:NuA3 HAT complex component NTO1